MGPGPLPPRPTGPVHSTPPVLSFFIHNMVIVVELLYRFLRVWGWTEFTHVKCWECHQPQAKLVFCIISSIHLFWIVLSVFTMSWIVYLVLTCSLDFFWKRVLVYVLYYLTITFNYNYFFYIDHYFYILYISLFLQRVRESLERLKFWGTVCK